MRSLIDLRSPLSSMAGFGLLIALAALPAILLWTGVVAPHSGHGLLIPLLILLALGYAAYAQWRWRHDLAGVSGRVKSLEGVLSADADTGAAAPHGGRGWNDLIAALEDCRARALAAKQADLAARQRSLAIESAVEGISSGLLLLDPQGTIAYANSTVRTLLRSARAELQQEYPGCDPECRPGTVFAPWARLVRAAQAPAGTGCPALSLTLGVHTYEVAVVAVSDASGVSIGQLLEWKDHSEEARDVAEIAAVIAAVAAGDFSRRMRATGKHGAAQQIAKGFNQLIGTVSRGLEDTARVLNAISRGQLTERVTGEFSGTFDQMKEDSNHTVERLRATVEQIKVASDSIYTAAREIAVGNLDLSNRTEQQAGNIEKTASAMEELNSTVRQNSEHARQASELARKSDSIAGQGALTVRQIVETMGAIQTSSKKIADIISVIDGIAFQTNILALNAAVEAARAGDQGRGFAVVASEVRGLAQRSALAAREIKSLIVDSVERVETGAALVDGAGKIIEQVVASVREVTGLLSEVANASKEQSLGLTQVTDAIQQMDQVTQQNAALVEQAAAAASSLQDQAGLLATTVATFQLDASAAGTPLDPARLDYDSVISAHLQWKHKLRDFLDGRGAPLDAEVVARDDKCALGCWIHSGRHQLEGDRRFTELRQSHAEFHRCAGQVIRHHKAGEGEAANALLDDAFLVLSERTVTYLREMKKSRPMAAAA